MNASGICLFVQVTVKRAALDGTAVPSKPAH